jgi:hypothetical protein
MLAFPLCDSPKNTGLLWKIYLLGIIEVVHEHRNTKRIR